MNSKLLSAIGLLFVSLSACKSDPQATARAHFTKGEQQLAHKKVDEAIIEYRRAIQADPRLGQARLRLADAYVQTGDGANALREYVRAAELLPDDEDAQIKAGNFMLDGGSVCRCPRRSANAYWPAPQECRGASVDRQRAGRIARTGKAPSTHSRKRCRSTRAA